MRVKIDRIPQIVLIYYVINFAQLRQRYRNFLKEVFRLLNGINIEFNI
jgi:hypothetical protein